jgi:hypothetical protein
MVKEMQQLLLHDRSIGALLGWFVPGLLLLTLGAMFTFGSYGVYETQRYRVSYRSGEAHSAVAYGSVMVVDVDNTRTAKPCEGAYVDRRIVQFWPGTHLVKYAMPIRERGIANDDLGHRSFGLIVNIPAPLEAGAGWIYQSRQHDNCGFWQSIFQNDGGWWGDFVASLQGGRDQPAPDAPVIVSRAPPPVPGVAFKVPDPAPPVPLAVDGH